MAQVLETHKIFANLKQHLKEKVSSLSYSLFLACVKIGKNYSSDMYISSQKTIAQELGIHYQLDELPNDISFEAFSQRIKELNNNEKITGIIVNKPFPSQWDENLVFSLIKPHKDIEGVTPYNLGRLFLKQPVFISPTVSSILEILRLTEIELYGKEVTIVGFSTNVGKPLALLLAEKLATVTITHIATYERERLPFYVKNADVLISCVGKPHIIKGEWIKEKAVVIDVGIGKKDGELTGDVEFEKALQKAAFITPVPGGVGRLTPLFLFDNLIKAAAG